MCAYIKDRSILTSNLPNSSLTSSSLESLESSNVCELVSLGRCNAFETLGDGVVSYLVVDMEAVGVWMSSKVNAERFCSFEWRGDLDSWILVGGDGGSKLGVVGADFFLFGSSNVLVGFGGSTDCCCLYLLKQLSKSISSITASVWCLVEFEPRMNSSVSVASLIVDKPNRESGDETSDSFERLFDGSDVEGFGSAIASNAASISSPVMEQLRLFSDKRGVVLFDAFGKTIVGKVADGEGSFDFFRRVELLRGGRSSPTYTSRCCCWTWDRMGGEGVDGSSPPYIDAESSMDDVS